MFVLVENRSWHHILMYYSQKMLPFFIFVCATLLLTGCFYPDEKRMENRMAYPDQLEAVQRAVDQFQADTDVIPIYDFDATTPLYQRYVVDFNKLIPRYMQDPPGTAFESGG